MGIVRASHFSHIAICEDWLSSRWGRVNSLYLGGFGRGEWIRTTGLLVPNHEPTKNQ
jgi:hypothetical protein